MEWICVYKDRMTVAQPDLSPSLLLVLVPLRSFLFYLAFYLDPRTIPFVRR